MEPSDISNDTQTLASGSVFVLGQEMGLLLTGEGLRLMNPQNDKKADKHSKHEVSLPWCEIIAAEGKTESTDYKISVHVIEQRKNRYLRKTNVEVKCKNDDGVNWTQIINEKCQQVPGRPKKLFVVINPIGGKQNAESMYHRHVEPLFKLAGFGTTVVVTERAKHAVEIGETQNFTGYDGIICLGGDGLYQEILQGYFTQLQREGGIDINDKDAQFIKPKIPFCLIPTGSSNGIVRFTNDDVRDIETSVLRVIRGETHSLNILTVHEPGKFVGVCGLAFGVGFVSDLMVRADELRWMKKARYTYTGLSLLFGKKRKFHAQMHYKLTERESGEASKSAASEEGGWIPHTVKNNLYTAAFINIGDIKTVGNKCTIDYFGDAGYVLLDSGCSNLSFFKLIQVYDGKPLRERLANLELLHDTQGLRIKVLRDEKETDQNVSSSRARERHLEHLAFFDGEILRIEGLEVEVRLQRSFVPMFACLPSLLKASQTS